jgi:hypothetical protein
MRIKAGPGAAGEGARAPEGGAMRGVCTMVRNEGTMDRVLRVALGLVMLSLVFVGPQTAWGWLGLVPLVTGLVGWCPVYTLFGVDTCGLKRG